MLHSFLLGFLIKMRKKVDIQSALKELNDAFIPKETIANLGNADLIAAESRLKDYSKYKAKESGATAELLKVIYS